MKKALLLFFSFTFIASMSMAQTFSDDFESYEVGDFLALSSPEWTTWGNSPGTSEDVRITDENASSGSKSIKFRATGASGGPQDVVLFFGGQKLTTGYLNTRMNMLVETGAYFNYQAEVAIGTTWAMNAFFEANGVGRITNSSNESIMQFTYPPGEWFDFEMNINFDANEWQIMVNGICVGSFSNNNNSIASIDLYPVAGNSFFVDDFAYTYSETAPDFADDVRAGLRATLDNGIAGNSIGLIGSITNNGSTVVTEFETEIALENDVIPFGQSGLNLAKGETIEFVVSEDYILPADLTTLTMNVKSVNGGAFDDEDICNDNASVVLFGVEPAPHKKVVVEEATGTWCGWCPRGTVWMDRMNNRYPNEFIGIAVHGGGTNEPMQVDSYDDGLNAPGFPNALVNRGNFIDPSAIEAPILSAVAVPSFAMLEHGALWDEDTRELTISLDLTAMEQLDPNYRVNVVLTEDGVTGTTSGYAQENYFSGSMDLIDDNGVNWRDLPSTVPAADMVYDHVARAILAPYLGMENSFADVLPVDGHKAYNFSYTIPDEFDEENMHIITFLINPNGTINTGESTTIAEAVENGFTLVTSTHSVDLDNATSVYPNPMNEYTTVDMNLSETTDVRIEVIDLSGKTAFMKTYNNRSGFFRTNVNTSTLPVGTYIMKINTDNFYTTKRISVVR
ncbi:MAG: Omp28-related outer membrane protein [Bacteroidota bacterium]